MKLHFKDFEEYYSYFSRLIERERREEISQCLNEIRRMSGKKREKLGRAILNVRGSRAGRGLGGTYLVKYSRENFPKTEISVGDIVLISKGKVDEKNPKGTVYQKGKNYIVVAFNDRPSRYIYGKGIRIDLYVSDITFKRMKDALKYLSQKQDLLPIILGRGKIEKEKIGRIKFFNGMLNASQRNAVIKALQAERIFLIHGPPGTGKTTTLVEAIVQHVHFGHRVLATADSNVAVDNLVDNLKNFVNVVRVGNPARVTKSLLEHTLDYLVQFEPEYKKAQKLWDEIEKLVEERDTYIRPTQQWRRGLGDDEILYLSRARRSVRGIPVDVMESMAKWIRLEKKIEEKVKKARELEGKAVEKILKRADVICATNSTAGSEVLENCQFDVIFIDEATQSTEPSTLIPIVKGNKIIMAGDHKQLPPTVMSFEARELTHTLFERMHEVYGHKIVEILNLQYRMNERIMNFSNREFYGGIIKSHESVKNITLEDLDLKKITVKGWMGEALEAQNVIVFIDTCGNMPERQRRGSTSYENPGEAKIVKELIIKLFEMGMDPGDIGVITPYDDQVDYLRVCLNEDLLEIKSVDGFQGREKEVILISFVRSNSRGDIGFLEDLRRLNVAITRAKRKLIMIGDASTLSKHPTYARLINYTSLNGKVLSLCDDFRHDELQSRRI
ncbi:MAG: IGHMBP2 family helicase [Thermoplasmata archaeon]|nr:IGHMBP2 family helicase [Thermoplasmata archaeon]